MENDLNNYCLDVMGVQQWIPRSYDHLILIQEKEEAGIVAFLEKILLALKWPSKNTFLFFAPIGKDDKQTINDLIKRVKPQSILVFGNISIEDSSGLKTLTLQPVSVLMNNIALKRQAWKDLQPFIL